jgi:hypothetical protein
MSDNATDRLREMLDERGVKWWPMHNNGYYRERDTEFVVDGKKHTAHEWGDGLAVYGLSPEQAVAATLGAGTCVMEYGGNVAEGTARAMDVYFCSECGSPNYNDCMPYYCIYCGKAVKR